MKVPKYFYFIVSISLEKRQLQAIFESKRKLSNMFRWFLNTLVVDEILPIMVR